MTYYVMDKVGNKVYGPMEDKQKAEEAIEEGVVVAQSALKALNAEGDLIRTDKLDEVEISYGGQIVALFEIITDDQVLDKDVIPEEFR